MPRTAKAVKQESPAKVELTVDSVHPITEDGKPMYAKIIGRTPWHVFYKRRGGTRGAFYPREPIKVSLRAFKGMLAY